MRATVLRGIIICLALGGLLFGSQTWAAETAQVKSIMGKVKDTQGNPVFGAMVTLEGKALLADAITVFTDRTGTYRFPELGKNVSIDQIEIRSRKVGFKTESTNIGSASADGLAEVDFLMATIDNVAEQVPASAWLDPAPTTPRIATGLSMVSKLCYSNCHQLPIVAYRPQVQRFIENVGRLAVPEREQAWIEHLARHRALHAKVGTRTRWVNVDPKNREDREFLEFHHMAPGEDETLMAWFLAKYLPKNFKKFSVSDFKEGDAPIGVKGTVIKEYQLEPTSDGWYREVAVARGSPYVWGIDLGGDRLVRLNPEDGSHKWLKIPGEGPFGPHTITPDAAGNLWISLEEINGLGVFDPRTEKWTKIFRDALEKGAISHDFATDWRGNIAFDLKGRLWLTIVNRSRLAAVNSKTGETKEYDLPFRKGHRGVAITYGAVMTSDKKHVWFTQWGDDVLGSFNTETLTVDTMIPFPNGTAPRRMSIDDNDVVWVALCGAGQILAYDTKTGTQKIYDLPDRSGSTYNLTWDPKRRVVWVGTTNSDKIYRFDPKAEKFTQYLLPHRGALLRVLPIDESGDIWTTYTTMPGMGPTMIAVLHPGEPDELDEEGMK